MRSSLSAHATYKVLPSRCFRKSGKLHDQVRVQLWKTSIRFNRVPQLYSPGTVIVDASNSATRIGHEHPPMQVPGDLSGRQGWVSWFARIEASRPHGCVTYTGRLGLRPILHPIADLVRSTQDRSLRR